MFDPDALSRHELTQACLKHPPRVFLVLGSGFAEVVNAFTPIQSWSYAKIPGMPQSTVHGHKGILTLAHKKETSILISEGRIHHYEGYGRGQVCTMMQTANALGCKIAILTNAAGGIHPKLPPGSMMILENHLILPGKPWNADQAHPGINPEKKSPYSKRLTKLATEELQKTQFPHLVGKYLMVSGPSYETPAEIRAFQTIGADAVGMSTAWEAEEADRLGMECLGISGISNKAAGLAPGKLNHEDIVGCGRQMGKQMETLLVGILENL